VSNGLPGLEPPAAPWNRGEGNVNATATDQPSLWPIGGKWKGRRLEKIDSTYLTWALGAIHLSARLAAEVRAELQARGQEPPRAPPRLLRPCPEHGTAGGVKLAWVTDSLQRRHLEARCRQCDRFLDRPPQTDEYVTLANAGGGTP
jgi:hypothetical protein